MQLIVAKLVYVSLVRGLELKKFRLNIEMMEFLLLFLLRFLMIIIWALSGDTLHI